MQQPSRQFLNKHAGLKVIFNDFLVDEMLSEKSQASGNVSMELWGV